MFKYSQESRAYEQIKLRTVLELEQTVFGRDNSKMISEIDRKLSGRYVPPVFDGDKSVEISHDKGYEKIYALLSQEFGLDRSGMTVMAYYSSLELLKEQNDNKNKTYKHIGHGR